MKKILIFLIIALTTSAFGQTEQKQNPTDFLPNGYVIYETLNGDLNNDGNEDCILIIKGDDKNQIIIDEDRGELDHNRRGIIILIKKNGKYELAVKNYNCFSSETEDGGVYFAPELSIEIKNRNLYFNYSHGRYGYWEYIFRFRNSDFELISYNSAHKSNFDSKWVTFDEKSINFLSRKKLIKEVIKVATDGKETYRQTWKNIVINKLIKLSEVKDFDELFIGSKY